MSLRHYNVLRDLSGNRSFSPHVHRSVIVPGAGLAAFLWRQRARRSRLLVRFHADVSTGVVAREEAAAAWRCTFHLHTTTRDEVSLHIVAGITNYLWLRDAYIYFIPCWTNIPVTMSETADVRGSATTTRSSWKGIVVFFHLEIAVAQCARLPTDRRQIHHRFTERRDFHRCELLLSLFQGFHPRLEKAMLARNFSFK